MRRHRLDLLSLVFGLCFVALALAALVDGIGLDIFQFRWVMAGFLVLGGLATLLGTVRSDDLDD